MNKKLILNILRPNRYNYMMYANALFLLCLLAVGYVDPLAVVMAYFIESIVIGIFNAFKMGRSIAYEIKTTGNAKASYGLILFFCFHYCFFIAIQSVFVFSFFSVDQGLFREPFFLIENYTALLKLDGMWLLIASMLVTHLFAYISNFLAEKRYRDFSANELMTKPYLRIVIQQFVVILSGFFLVFVHAGYVAAVLLILVRLGIDLALLALRENSLLLEQAAQWYACKNGNDPEKVKKQLLLFTE